MGRCGGVTQEAQPHPCWRTERARTRSPAFKKCPWDRGLCPTPKVPRGQTEGREALSTAAPKLHEHQNPPEALLKCSRRPGLTPEFPTQRSAAVTTPISRAPRARLPLPAWYPVLRSTRLEARKPFFFFLTSCLFGVRCSGKQTAGAWNEGPARKLPGSGAENGTWEHLCWGMYAYAQIIPERDVFLSKMDGLSPAGPWEMGLVCLP